MSPGSLQGCTTSCFTLSCFWKTRNYLRLLSPPCYKCALDLIEKIIRDVSESKFNIYLSWLWGYVHSEMLELQYALCVKEILALETLSLLDNVSSPFPSSVRAHWPDKGWLKSLLVQCFRSFLFLHHDPHSSRAELLRSVLSVSVSLHHSLVAEVRNEHSRLGTVGT